MAILSLFEGYTEISFVLFYNELDANDHKVFKFPYTYSFNLFGNSFSREKFYRDVFGIALKELNVDLKDCELYASGIMTPPDLPFETVKSSTALANLSPNHIFVSSQSISIYDQHYSSIPLDLDSKLMDFRANLDLYHNIVYKESLDIVMKDALLRSLISKNQFSLDQQSYVLTGDRFREAHYNRGLAHLLVLDILKNPGIYHLRLDENNLVANSFLLSTQNIEFPSIGTLVNVEAPAEVLYESDIGTSQIIDLVEDQIFILPLDSGSTARIIVKNSDNVMERMVNGGDIGVIFDTRDKKNKPEFKEVYLNMIKEHLHKI
jgi:hypothetical protein